MTNYDIKKTEVELSSGRIIAAYNVIDTKDGWIFDTFSLRRDAKHWIKKQLDFLKANKQG